MDSAVDTRSDAKEERLNLPKGRKTALTFERAAPEFLDRLEATGGRNLVAKRRQIRLYLSTFFGSQRLIPRSIDKDP